MNKQELLDLQAQIEEAKTKIANLTGQKDYQMNQLRVDWGCTSIAKAKIKLGTFTTKINNLQITIEEGIKNLKENYEFE